MHLSFIFPNALWLLLLLPPILALTLGVPRRVARWRLWSSLALRTVALLGLVLALAGAQLVRPVGSTTTIFLLDGSDSVSLSQRARAEEFIQASLADMPPDARAGIVVFGQRALVERTPSDEDTLGQIASQPGGGATNVEDAIQLGLALLPAEGYQRLVLLSDGGENSGDGLNAARVAAARGVPIDVVSLSGLADGIDAQVTNVELPAAAREGQRLRMRIELDSSAETTGRLTVEGPNGMLLVDQQVNLQAGPQQLEVVLPEAQPAFNRYIVRIDAPNDARAENNASEAYSFVSGQPRILIVEGQPGEALNFAGALKAARNEVEVVAPEGMPDGIGGLSNYDAMVLANVPRRALPDRALGALSAYVHDLGRSLMMVGGDESFGAGGWRDTPVEEALPVSMDIPSQVQFPPVSIVVLIDISGSMAQEEGGRTKIQLAAEGAQRIAALMRDEDELTVVPFDSEAKQVVGPLPGSKRDQAIEALSRMEPGGGGINIHDGLAEAAKYARQSDKPIKHIITITDGADTVQQEGALEIVRQLNEQDKVTLTSIAIGEGDHVPFIRTMADIGKGRTFLTDKASDIPSILADETQVVIQPYIVEETFTPARGGVHPILRDIDAAPQLYGYVATTPRQTAQVLLASPRGDPILAVWQHGLGRALAWTSDLKGQWGKDWVQWGEFPRVSAQMLSWLLPARTAQNLTLETSSSGDALVLTAQARDAQGRPQTGLDVRGQLLRSNGSSVEVTLREIGPGEYRTTVSGEQPGAYLAQLVAQDGQGQPVGVVTAGAVVPRSAEYRSRGANPALLDGLSRSTSGRLNPAPQSVFDVNNSSQGAVREISVPLLWLVLLLLPFDIAIRRLTLAREQVMALRRRFTRRGREQGTGNREQELGVEGSTINHQPSTVSHQRSAVSGQAVAAAGDGKVAAVKPSPKAKREQELERLREAQEQARRRARGEE
jgi:uncharacterized membrane protein